MYLSSKLMARALDWLCGSPRFSEVKAAQERIRTAGTEAIRSSAERPPDPLRRALATMRPDCDLPEETVRAPKR